ncbi:MAG: 50S ribosomal protein L18 [Candidatus Wallbacteria bacterium]
MFNKVNRKEQRKARHFHIRKAITGTTERPRLVVFRSLKHISVQVIDDVNGKTIVAASTCEKDARKALKHTDSVEGAKYVGKVIAERAKGKNIATVSFDRGGNGYTGRIKALADAAREAGLNF